MKALVWASWLAFLAGAIAVGLHANQGAVVALAPPWRVDLSLNLFLLVLVVGAWIAFRAGRISQRLRDFPERVRLYRERRVEVGALRGLRESLKALLEGRFARAERAAQRAQGSPSVAALAALLAARAAHRMQEHERREHWLELAEADPELATARLVISAEMWAEQRDSGRALQVIEHLHGAGARHIHAMRIALLAHLQSQHWDDAIRIVRALDKHRGLPGPASSAYKVLAYRGLLRENANDGAALERIWNSIPGTERVIPDLALEAARAFQAVARTADAAHMLEQALAHGWSEALLEEYGRCPAVNVGAALARVEAWMQQYGRSAVALRCLGRICLRARLWGKARIYLEESQRIELNAETSLALAELAEAVGDTALAAQCFRDAAIGMASRVPKAPEPSARAFRREQSL